MYWIRTNLNSMFDDVIHVNKETYYSKLNWAELNYRDQGCEALPFAKPPDLRGIVAKIAGDRPLRSDWFTRPSTIGLPREDHLYSDRDVLISDLIPDLYFWISELARSGLRRLAAIESAAPAQIHFSLRLWPEGRIGRYYSSPHNEQRIHQDRIFANILVNLRGDRTLFYPIMKSASQPDSQQFIAAPLGVPILYSASAFHGPMIASGEERVFLVIRYFLGEIGCRQRIDL